MKTTELPVFRRYAAMTGWTAPHKVKSVMYRRLQASLGNPPLTDDQRDLAKLHYAVVGEELHRVRLIRADDARSWDKYWPLHEYEHRLEEWARVLSQKLKRPQLVHNWVPRDQRWKKADRDQRRAERDLKFRRQLERQQRAQQRLQTIAIQLARMYDSRVKRIRGVSRRSGILYGHGSGGYTEWKNRRPVRYHAANAGVMITDTEVVLYPVRSKFIHLPKLPKKLLQTAVVGEAYADGLLACRLPGVDARACYSLHENKWTQCGWSIRGVRVSEAVAYRNYTAAEALAETNAEVRRIMLERLPGGLQALLSGGGFREVHRDEFGVLYWDVVRSGSARDLAVVKVINSSPEPDGTFKEYLLRVPGNIDTAKAAVAWTFDVPEYQFQPVVQT